MSPQLNGQRIAELRMLKGWSQETLAEKAGCSKKTVENAERGKKMRIRSLGEIAGALGVAPAELVVRDGEPTDDETPPRTDHGALLGSVPPIPSLVVGRDGALRHLKERLTRSPLGDGGQRLTVVHGFPGVGKSTIAASLAHDGDMAGAFPDGILWVSLGQTPDVLAELASCGRAIGTDVIQRTKSVPEASQQLRGLLYAKRMLLIVDDVWKVEDAIAFRVGGRNCATLVTTRLTSVAERLSPTPDDSFNLDVLDDASALELLRTLAPTVVARHPAECEELLREVEGLPLAIEVAGRLLHSHYQRWESAGSSGAAKLLRELKDGARILRERVPASMTGLLQETTPTVAALLQRSTDTLDAAARDRFAYLGAFAPKPAAFDLDLMARTWKVSHAEARVIADGLIDHGLLAPVREGWFWIHGLLVSHARALCT